MSCSYRLSFHLKNDDREHKKKVNACQALAIAGHDLPDSLAEYFGSSDPELALEQAKERLERGHMDVMEGKISDVGDADVVSALSGQHEHGNEITIDLDRLPAEVRLIKVSIAC